MLAAPAVAARPAVAEHQAAVLVAAAAERREEQRVLAAVARRAAKTSQPLLNRKSNYCHFMRSLIIASLLVLPLASCTSGPNAQTGTVIGALGGAAAGGIIGNQSGRGLEGAAIGAGVGGLAGNAIGGAQDQRNAEYYNRGYYR